MSDRDSKIIGDDLLGDVNAVYAEDADPNKLSGINAVPETESATELTNATTKKKGSKLQLIAVGSLAAVIIAGFLFIKMDMNRQAQQPIIPINEQAENELFGSAPAQGFSEAQSSSSWVDAPQQQSTMQDFEQSPWASPQAAQQQFSQASLPSSSEPELPVSFSQQPMASNISSAELSDLSSKVDGLFALLNDISQKQMAFEEKLAEVESKANASSKSKEGDFVTNRQFLNSLSSLRALQAQSERLTANVASINEKLGVEPSQPLGAQARTSRPVAAQSQNTSTPTGAEVQQLTAQPQPSNNSVVHEQARPARELAWSSYIEDFGVATIDGTPDLVELRPGDLVIGRGLIRKITPYGCIEFANGSRYAPTNGVCK